jgi:hypothetical protein
VEEKLSELMNKLEGMNEDYVEAEYEKWSDVKTKIEDASTALGEAQEKAAVVERTGKELELTLQGLREQFMIDHGVSRVSYSVKYLIGFMFHFMPKRFFDIFFIEYW